MEFSEKFAPVIWVTLTYIGVYYAFLVNVLRVKVRVVQACKSQGVRFDRYTSVDPQLRAADRIQLNTLEHMPAFLSLLWLHAAVIDPSQAATLGWLYVALRILYPFFVGAQLSENIRRRVLINTFSGYLILMSMAGSVIYGLI